MEAWERGLRLQLSLRGVSGAILGKTECTTNVVKTDTATTPLCRKQKSSILEWTELLSTLSDTSVEDHESEECNTRLATSTMVEDVDEVDEAAVRGLHQG